MEIIKNLGEYFNGGDPLVRDWFMVRSNYLPFILSFGYVVMSVVGPSLMKNRKPFDLRKIMIVYNFSIVLTYLIAISVACYFLTSVSWDMLCRRGFVKQGEPTYWIAYAGWVGYILKYIEFLDTVFFVLRKKEHLVSFLHVSHHAVVPILGWTLLRTEINGTQAFPIVLNSLVHVCMYTYYGLAAMGIRFRKYIWWKKHLTQIQMVQFFIIILYVIFVVPYSGCKMITSSALMDIFFAPFFLFLFYGFYQATFKPSTTKTE